MQEKLSALAAHLTEVEQQLADPAVYTDREKLTALRREQKELAPVVECWQAYLRAQDTAREAEEMLSDLHIKGELVPTWVPDRFSVQRCEAKKTEAGISCRVVYTVSNNDLILKIWQKIDEGNYQIEKDMKDVSRFVAGESTTFSTMENPKWRKRCGHEAIWSVASWEMCRKRRWKES